MSHKTLNELVREQILAEGPEWLPEDGREEYIDEALNAMSHVELLERISDARRRASVMDIKNWI